MRLCIVYQANDFANLSKMVSAVKGPNADVSAGGATAHRFCWRQDNDLQQKQP